jgi:uncharacterized membrane protein YphA (DoxX/SURF4 family)
MTKITGFLNGHKTKIGAVIYAIFNLAVAYWPIFTDDWKVNGINAAIIGFIIYGARDALSKIDNK